MIEIYGKHNTAIVYSDQVESSAWAQIMAVCNREEFAASRIRIMPDVHAGMGCTIGTTMTITDKIVPGMVGVDIGCGMETVKIAEERINFSDLDSLIRRKIPSGHDVRKLSHSFADISGIEKLRCADEVNIGRGLLSIGTLGGGNHFIEVDRDGEGALYIVIHSGSRHLGKEVAEYYQNQAHRALWGGAKHQIAQTVERLKAEGRQSEIQKTVKELKKEHAISVPRDLSWVEGGLMEDYLHDMAIIQRFADLNRRAMMKIILSDLNLTEVERFTTIHNYVDLDSMILRKGAVSAKEGEKLLIPINMRDGSLICIGKGNEDWNCSAPHGAGRLMSRGEARQTLSVSQFREQMEGIFTTCVSKDTIDEAPMAYKNADEIIAHISPTAAIVERIVPVYNFKASE